MVWHDCAILQSLHKPLDIVECVRKNRFYKMEGRLMGFEPMEVYRARNILTPETVLIFNRDPIMPVTVSSGGKPYPDIEKIIGEVKKNVKAVYTLSAKEKAAEVGNEKVTNVVLLGALSATGLLPFSKDEMKESVKISVPKKAVEENLKAFEMGYESVKEQ